MTVPTDALVERGHLAPQPRPKCVSPPAVTPSRSRRFLPTAGSAAAIEEMPVGYRFADADELWFFVSELRGPVALALAELPESERAGSAARSSPDAPSRRRLRARRHQPERSRRIATISRPGALAEWLGSGLQSRLQRFESARRLYWRGHRTGMTPTRRHERVFDLRAGRAPSACYGRRRGCYEMSSESCYRGGLRDQVVLANSAI